jgi:hypothetical protein
MRKPSIPSTGSLAVEIGRIVEPMKINIEMITGARPGVESINVLPDTATLAEVITQLNLILSRIEHSG